MASLTGICGDVDVILALALTVLESQISPARYDGGVPALEQRRNTELGITGCGRDLAFENSGVFDRHLRRREGERRDRPHVQVLVPARVPNVDFVSHKVIL